MTGGAARRPFGVPRRADETPRGAYVALEDLVRLRFQARGFTFLPRQPIHGLLAGRHASRLRGRGLDFDELRRYLPGDDVRDIDWKVTARAGKPHVRVYREERDRAVLFVVDQRRTMFFGSREATKSVVAAEIAALGAWRVLEVGDRAGAVVFDDRDAVVIRPQRSQRQVMRILDEVVRRNHALGADDDAEPGPHMLDQALERAVRVACHDHLICIASDGFGRGPRTVELITRLARHNDVLVCHVSDALERDLPDAGPLVVAEGARQLEVDTGRAAFRDAFRVDFLESLDKMRRTGRSRGTPVLPIDTAGAVAAQVRDALAPHLRRRR